MSARRCLTIATDGRGAGAGVRRVHHSHPRLWESASDSFDSMMFK